jgi:integrase
MALLIEAGQMTASDYVPIHPDSPLASDGASTDAYPLLGKLSVSAIDTGKVLEVVQPLWATKTETASRLRGRIERVLGWATFRGYRQGDNPARWKDHLDHELPLRSEVRKVKHHAALPYREIGAFMMDLRKREGISARALEFAILCASRSAEVRNAAWAEIDLDGAVWTIPEDRMKAEKEHVVPLSDAAVSLLKGLPRRDGVDFVFPAPRDGALSDMALTAVLKRMDRPDLTQHGFRSTFREWAGETTAYPREVIEHALAHQLADKAEAAYQRGTLLPKRARLMKDWAAFCATAPSAGDVSPIRRDVA